MNHVLPMHRLARALRHRHGIIEVVRTKLADFQLGIHHSDTSWYDSAMKRLQPQMNADQRRSNKKMT